MSHQSTNQIFEDDMAKIGEKAEAKELAGEKVGSRKPLTTVVIIGLPSFT